MKIKIGEKYDNFSKEIIFKIKDKNIKSLLRKLYFQGITETPGVAILALFLKMRGKSLDPKYFKNAHLPLFMNQGNFLYSLIRNRKAKNIVEFGTSLGFSTIFLAAAAKETGGKVITSELLTLKCEQAKANLSKVNLSQYVDIRQGDAEITLKNVPSDVDIVIMDGWKEKYLPVLKVLEKNLKSGALVYTDNSKYVSAGDYWTYLQESPHYLTTRNSRDWGRSAISVYTP